MDIEKAIKVSSFIHNMCKMTNTDATLEFLTGSFEGLANPFEYHVVTTKDRGRIPALCVDIPCPVTRNTIYRHLGVGKRDVTNKLEVTLEGLPERVLHLPDSETAIKQKWKRFFRYWNEDKVYVLKNVLPSVSNTLKILDANGARWGEKLQDPWEFHRDTYSLATLLLMQQIAHHEVFTFYDSSSTAPFAICEYVEEPDTNTVHWVNTYRTDAIERAGNTVLMYLMLQYPGWRLNMGCDFFDYKKLWSDTVEYAPGLAFVE